jgi:hypothetical protein
MSAMTTYTPAYGTLTGDAVTPKRKGLFLRFFDRLIETRMRQANDVIRQHSHLVPRELEEQVGWRLTERSENSLPFLR